MRYFKNSELVRKYGVSDKTVRNWIAAAGDGKLDLKICTDAKGKKYIADSVGNGQTLRAIVDSGKKFRNNRNHKIVEPTAEFYKLYNDSQVIEIANTLERYKELSWCYSYYGDAATYWDKYLKELFESGAGSLISNTVDTLATSYAYIDEIIKDFPRVNIVNLCIGNNLAIKDMAAHVQASGKLHRFIAIDISSDVLDIAQKNAQEWYGDNIQLEKYQMDVRYGWFGDILAKDPNDEDADSIVNLVFLIAGPLVNFKRPEQVLFTICDSMGVNDVFFVTQKRDTEETRSFFDFNIKSDASLSGFGRNALADLLGIDKSSYEVEQIYEEAVKMRYAQLRLKNNIDVKFEREHYKKIVKLKKGEALRLWKSTQKTDAEIVAQLHDVGFDVLQTVQSKDQQLIMTVAKIAQTS